MRRFKIASSEIDNKPLMDCLAGFDVPIVASCGLSDPAIDLVYDRVGNYRFRDLTLLHCVSRYPCPDYKAAMRRINFLSGITANKIPVGFSDHSTGTTQAILAVALGACMIEKHFSLLPDAPDAEHAFDADGFVQYVKAIRAAEAAMNSRFEIDPETAKLCADRRRS